MKKAIILILGILFSNLTYSQIIDSIIYSIQDINQIEYQVKTWNVSENNKDTIFFTSHHNLYFTSEDHYLGAYFNIEYQNKTEKYNGGEYIMVDKIEQNATIVNLKRMPEWKDRNVRCSDSFLSIFWELVKAKNDSNFIIETKDNEIKLFAKDIVFFGRIVSKTGVNTVFTINYDENTFYPISETILSEENGKVISNHGIQFSQINVFDSHDKTIFSKESIEKSIDIVNHTYVKLLEVGDKIPNWCIYPVPNDSNKILLKDLFRDNFLLIEFWFVNCQYCIKSIPAFNYLHSKFEKRGLKIIYANAVNTDKDSDIVDFKMKYKAEFNMYRFGNIYERGSLPTVMLVDKKGIIRYKKNGYSENIKDEIEQLMIDLNK